MKSTNLYLLILIMVISGCCSAPTRTNVTTTSVDEVLNEVKDELNNFASRPSQVVPKYGECHPKNSPKIKFTPTKITLKLKTVATSANDPTLGIVAPLGVVSFDPSYSGSYSRSRTQSLEIPLDVATMDTPSKDIEPNSKPGDHPLADAMVSFRDSLLKVDHAKTPCLAYKKGSNFKMSLVFDVVNKTSLGASLKLAVFKVADKQTETDEAHQTLDLEFTMGDGQLK